jgi:hypothetical protein
MKEPGFAPSRKKIQHPEKNIDPSVPSDIDERDVIASRAEVCPKPCFITGGAERQNRHLVFLQCLGK